MTRPLLHDNPFPGIRSYEIQEDELFFGRELQVRELIEKLFHTRFLAIVGSSGCGKSSLIKAGVVPALMKNKTGRCNTPWTVNIFRPAEDPLGNLARSLAGESKDPGKLTEQLRSGKEALRDFLTVSDTPGNASRLIIIDQFEELFRFKKSSALDQTLHDTSIFVEQILSTLSHPELPVYFILSMRTDFLDDCTEFRGLTETINQGYYLVPRMNNEERRLAITGPVRFKGCRISEELVDQLLQDVGDDPDQLPILQHAMMRTWDYWTLNRIGDQPIGLEHYNAIGTMKEALSFHLEELFTELREFKSKYIAEKLFKALTEINKESRGTRRPTQLSEIMTLAEARQEEVIRVIDTFRQPGCAFLIPPVSVDLTPDSIIDISHESIMRVWTRLKNWVEEESQSAQLYLRLSKSAELYQDGKSGLWVDPELQVALQWKEHAKPNATWAMRYDPAFDRAISFLQFSKKQHELELSQKENLQKRNLKRAKNSAIILGIASVVSILFLLISLNLRFKAEASRKEALEKEKLAFFERKKMEEQRKEAILQKKISEQQQRIAEQQEMITEQQRQYAVRQQIIAQEQTVVAVSEKKKADLSRQEALVARDEAQSQRKEAVSQKLIADKERIKAEESEKNTKRLRLLAVARTMAIQANQLYATVKDELPGLLAVEAFRINEENGGFRNDPVIYTALSGISADPVILRGHEDGVRSIVLSGDGKTLYSCGDDNHLLVWKLSQQPSQPRELQLPKQAQGTLRSLGLTHDEHWLVAGTTKGELIIWDCSSFTGVPKIISGHSSVVNKLAMHPQKNFFISAGADGKILQWKYEKGTFSRSTVDSLKTPVYCIAFDPQGLIMASGDGNGNLKLYNVEGEMLQPKSSFKAGHAIYSIAFNKERRSLSTGLVNGMILTWDLHHPNDPPHEIIGRHATGITALMFSHDGTRLASSGYDRTLKISDLLTPASNPVAIDNHELWVYDLLFSQDDKKIISCSADKTIRIFSTTNAEMAASLKKTLKRNMTPEEWQKMVGGDIPYEKTRADLP